MVETSEESQQPVEADVILSQDEQEKDEKVTKSEKPGLLREKSIVEHDKPESDPSRDETDAPARDAGDENGKDEAGVVDEAKDTDACLRDDTENASSSSVRETKEEVSATSDDRHDEDFTDEPLEPDDVEAMVLEGDNAALEMSLAELVEETLQDMGSPPCNEAVIYSVFIECGGLTGFMVKQIIQDSIYFGFVKWKVRIVLRVSTMHDGVSCGSVRSISPRIDLRPHSICLLETHRRAHHLTGSLHTCVATINVYSRSRVRVCVCVYICAGYRLVKRHQGVSGAGFRSNLDVSERAASFSGDTYSCNATTARTHDDDVGGESRSHNQNVH